MNVYVSMLTSTVVCATVANTRHVSVWGCFRPCRWFRRLWYIDTIVRRSECRRFLEVVDDIIEDVLAIFVWVHGGLFLFFKLIVVVVVSVISIAFRGPVREFSVGHPICADCIFDSVLHDTDSLGSATYFLIRSQSTGVVYRVTFSD